MKHEESRTPVKPWWPLRSRMRENGRRRFATTLSMLALSLTACATRPTPPLPVECPKIPSPPAVTTPLPSHSYSESLGLKLKSWRERLMGTPAM